MHGATYTRTTKPDRNDHQADAASTTTEAKKRSAAGRRAHSAAELSVQPFRYPNVPEQLRENRNELLVVGVFGKSHNISANKMAPFDVLRHFPGLEPLLHSDCEITFYHRPPIADVTTTAQHCAAVLYMHIVSPLDSAYLEHLPAALLADGQRSALSLVAELRSQTARTLLLAIQVCHIVCVCESSAAFDSSLLQLFKAVRSVRDTFVVPTLPGVLRSGPPASGCDRLGRDGRLCSPRFLFHFERPHTDGAQTPDELRQLEFDLEDRIYKQLRHEFVITNSAGASLFSIPRNRRFVYVETGRDQRTLAADDSAMLLGALELLNGQIDGATNEDDSDEFAPYEGFARKRTVSDADTWCLGVVGPPSKERSFSALLHEHLREALESGFDESPARFKAANGGRHHFVLPTAAEWLATFDVMHALFVAAAPSATTTVPVTPSDADERTFEASCGRFRAQLDEQLDAVLNTDARFLAGCAHKAAIDRYLDRLPDHYPAELHRKRTEMAVAQLRRFVRSRPDAGELEQRVRRSCQSIWLANRQQCEAISLRGMACTKAAQHVQDDAEAEDGGCGHQSSAVHISACNCGRMQGRRADPFSVRQANYEFYAQLQRQCIGCRTRQRFRLPVDFGPSLFVDRSSSESLVPVGLLSPLQFVEMGDAEPTIDEPTTAAAGGGDLLSQQSQRSLSIGFSDAGQEADDLRLGVSKLSMQSPANESWLDDDDEDDSKEGHEQPDAAGESGKATAADVVVDVLADNDAESDEDINYFADIMDEMRQAEERPASAPVTPAPVAEAIERVAPSVIDDEPPAPAPLLVQPTVEAFASWSLLCLGSSSLYGHDTGLPETLQTGLLDGHNRLLPWIADVSAGLRLKVFIGFEYECVRGHRFLMQSAKRMQRTSADPDDCRDVVERAMPLYVPCVCRRSVQKTDRLRSQAAVAGGQQQPLRVAQLMRVHMVTPKAPVQLCVDPKVRVVRPNGDEPLLFDMGLGDLAVLSPRAYWVLRFPFAYGPALPAPAKLTEGRPWTSYGCLEANMFAWIV